jgi:Rha family phage regulatory protein
MSNQLHPYVTLLHGKVKTTSLTVAEYFGKRHDHVLRAIRNLECSREFHLLNFGEVFYEVDAGNGSKVKYPMFEITKDGFVFLVMGFTGSAAAKLKEAYILADFDYTANLTANTAIAVRLLAVMADRLNTAMENANV